MDKHHRLSLGLLLLSLAGPLYAAPVAQDDTRTVPANTPITIDVLNNDSDTEGLAIELNRESVTQPEFGTVAINADGGITYTPPSGFIGQDVFQYSITSSDGEVTNTASATVTINVVPATTNGGFGPNTASVAGVIDQVCAEIANVDQAELSAGGIELQARCQELANLAATNPAEAARALRQIAPEETLALSKLGVNASQFQGNVVGARLSQLGQGLTRINTGGLSWSGNLAGGVAGDDSILAKVGVFASIQLEDADKDTNAWESGFEYAATSLTAGADYAFSDQWFVGAALGFTDNQLDFKDQGGDVKADIFTVIGYSTYHLNNFNVDVQAGFSNSSIELNRHISYNTFRATTSGETNGDQWFFSTELQYLFSWNALTLYPAIKYHYMDSNVDGYADTDAGGWDVVLGEQQVSQSTLQLGVQATYALTMSWGVLIPSLELTLYDDLDTDQELVTGYFAYAPGEVVEFGMYGEAPDDMYYQAGAGFSLLFPGGTSAFAGLRQTLGYDDYSARQFQAGVRMEF